MEPIGTITNFYPFLTEETREIVESTLKVAKGYDDFVSKLVDIVLTQDETNDITYFTTIQAWMSANLPIFDRLRELILEDEVLRPWAYSLRYLGAPIDFSREDLPSTVELALETSPDDWVRVHLLILGSGQSPVLPRQRFLEQAEEIIERRPELRCFLSEILIRRGRRLRFGADVQGAIGQFERARKVAEDHNEIVRMADANMHIAGQLKESDIWLAIGKMEESYQTFKSIGAFAWAGIAAGNLGLFHTIIGEYDLAVQFYVESTRIFEPRGRGRDYTSVILARIYCDIDLPEEALEWLKWKRNGEDITPQVIKELPSTEDSYFLLEVARTMIQLGQLDGIPELLDEAQKAILQRGDEGGLIPHNFMCGLLEISLGNYEEGMQSIAVALGDAERLKYQVHVNTLLIALAKAEVGISKREEGTGETETSGPWMTRLEVHARENDYPGIKMQHALLKAEYQVMISEPEAAKLTLQDALTFTDEVGVKTLRKRINDRLEELEGIPQ
ncbi:MAG: hypothetical protein ACXABV_19585 [Candidatus Thorarchaeota archaeon]